MTRLVAQEFALGRWWRHSAVELPKRKILELMLYLIEREGRTPHIVIDRSDPKMKTLNRLIPDQPSKLVLNISHNSFQQRRLHSWYLAGTTRLQGQVVRVRIPLTSIRSIFADENKVGWRFSA